MASSMKPLVRTYKGSGVINPNSFIKFYTTAPYSSKNPAVTQCGAGDRPNGIAQNETASVDGDEIEVAFPGGGAKLQVSATVAPGNYLKSDASGYGTPTTTAGDAYGAMGVEGGVTGDIIGTHVVFGEKYNATA